MERVVAETEEALQAEKSAHALTRQEVYIADLLCRASAAFHPVLLCRTSGGGGFFCSTRYADRDAVAGAPTEDGERNT